ncbi:desmethylxanthohumol 6'-O-methyltransferase-like protein [Tanacetum coccineum]
MKQWHVAQGLAWLQFISDYKFDELKGTLDDIGGDIRVAINKIVNAYPHLKGINFDMPHVISTAPSYKGVTHVEGDMFKAIPSANSIFLKTRSGFDGYRRVLRVNDGLPSLA